MATRLDQEEEDTKNPKLTKNNKLAQLKETHQNAQKLKSAGPLKTAHICCTSLYTFMTYDTAQKNSNNLPSYSSCNHRRTYVVY